MKIDEKAIDGMIRRAVAAMKVASERSIKDAYFTRCRTSGRNWRTTGKRWRRCKSTA